MEIKKLTLKAIALLVSVLPPFLAVISYFPIWKEKGSSFMLSGFTLCLILLCAVPLFRAIKSFFNF